MFDDKQVRAQRRLDLDRMKRKARQVYPWMKDRAVILANHLQCCSCLGCGNRRQSEGPTRQEQIAEFDFAQQLAPRQPMHRARKLRRKWCRGKVGVEHVKCWVPTRHHHRGWDLVCSRCGKQLGWYYGQSAYRRELPSGFPPLPREAILDPKATRPEFKQIFDQILREAA